MLVSIIVITYNSGKFVLETLESAKVQSYQNIELIISDDGSTDKTIEICTNWLKTNEGRFARTELITSETNTGVPANCNRGVKAATSKWLKIIAGDDVLDKNCIYHFMNFADTNPDASVISSSIQLFTDSFSKENFGKIVMPQEYIFFDPNITSNIQYDMLLRMNYVHGPSVILKKAALIDVGGFDERYRFFEDYPIFLKLTQRGYKIYGLNKVTAYYRRHDSTILRQAGSRIFSDFYLKKRAFDLEYIHPNITMVERIADNIEYNRLRLFDLLGVNKETTICKLLFSITNLLNPFSKVREKAILRSVDL